MIETTLTKGARTRRAILDRATALASERGLEALSIGDLADDLGMSKSGLFAHFGSKQELQVATVDRAAEIFAAAVIAPAREAPKGVARVWSLCDHQLGYMERRVFPGGCFFSSAAFEYKARPGAVRDRVVEVLHTWSSYLAHAVEQAQAAGEIAADVDAAALAFELSAFTKAANSDYQLFGDPAVFAHARTAVRRRLEMLQPR
jgi:AcrR family transcriptional regulator